MSHYNMDTVRKTTIYSSNWGRFVIRPIADRILWFVANYTILTPNEITLIGFIFGIGSALCFLQASAIYLVLGAFLYQLSYAIDCVDGGLARLKKKQSEFGLYFDNVLDILKVSIVIFCFSYGQFYASGNFLFIAVGYSFACALLIGFIHFLLIEKIVNSRKKQSLDSSEEKSAIRSHNRPWTDVQGGKKKTFAFKHLLKKYNISIFPTSTDLEALNFFIIPILLIFGINLILISLSASILIFIFTLLIGVRDIYSH